MRVRSGRNTEHLEQARKKREPWLAFFLGGLLGVLKPAG